MTTTDTSGSRGFDDQATRQEMLPLFVSVSAHLTTYDLAVLHTALAVAAALVGFAFTLSTLDRWLASRRPHELAWTAAFSFFTLAAVFLAIGAESGWNGATFRGFYLFGAIINVPFLGLGTLYLLGSPRVAKWSGGAACAFACFSAGVLMTAPFIAPVPVHELAQGSEVFGPLPRILAAVGSGLGALVVFSGAVVSAWRRKTMRGLAGNGLIAVGTVVSGASGMLNSLGDEMTAFSVTLVIGIALIFAGFLTLTSSTRSSAPIPSLTWEKSSLGNYVARFHGGDVTVG